MDEEAREACKGEGGRGMLIDGVVIDINGLGRG